MIRLITKTNGVAAVLFHVKHSASLAWQFRWRICGDAYPARYRQWREVETQQPRASFHPEIIGCPLEVEWREASAAEWSQVALHQPDSGHCQFRVKALGDFQMGRALPFDAVSSIIGGGVACYRFAPFELAAGVETVIRGEGVGSFADNVLLRAGEFYSRDPRLEVENLGPSQDSFSPPLGGPRTVCLHPGLAARRLFAFTGHNFRKEIEASELTLA
jgi:hypothetical protein